MSHSTIPPDAWLEKYSQLRPLYEQFTAKLEGLLRDLVQAEGIEYHLLESRTKAVSSLREKINRPSKHYQNPIEELTDFAGIRIITYYQADADLIGKLIEAQFSVDWANSYRPSSDPSEFGYSSTHFVVSLPLSRQTLLEWRKFAQLRAEIQVRTVLQHAWAAISHKLQYKREKDVPNQLKRKLFRLAALFELADDEFIALKETTGHLSDSISAQLSSGHGDIEVNHLSLEKFLAQSTEVRQLRNIAEKAGFTFIPPDENSTSDLVGSLARSNIRTIEEFRSTLERSLKWGDDYFNLQMQKSRDIGNSPRWDVDEAFICQLLVFPSVPEHADVQELVRLGWDDEVATRVVTTARDFAKALTAK